MFDLVAYVLTGVFTLWFIECIWQLGRTIYAAQMQDL